jgi:hypothetical protein
MSYPEAIALLRTRGEVRVCLAKQIEDVIGAWAQDELPSDLGELATGSDREVVQTSLRLDKSFGTRNAAHAKSPDAALGCQVRDLFTQALRRMKELPPDPRETLHAKPLPSTDAMRHGPRRRGGRRP